MNILDKICSRKRWILLTSLLFIIALGTSGYICYLEFFAPKQMSKNAILNKFGNVFYTEEQIEKFVEDENIDRIRAGSTDKYKKQCSFSCKKLKTYQEQQISVLVDLGFTRGETKHITTKEENSGTLLHRRSNMTDDKNSTWLEYLNSKIDGFGDRSNVTTSNSSMMIKITNETSNSNKVQIHYETIPKLGRIVGRLNSDETRRERYHGCCVSRSRIVIPTRLTTHDGRSVRAVQFRGRNQIYWDDECTQVSDCTGCSCYKETRYMVAVVVDDDGSDDSDQQMDDASFEGYRLEMVVVPGCCKCLNGV